MRQSNRKPVIRSRHMIRDLDRKVKRLEMELVYKQREIDSLSQLCKNQTPPRQDKKAKTGSPPLLQQAMPTVMHFNLPLDPPASYPAPMPMANGPHYQTHQPQGGFYPPNPPTYRRSDPNLEMMHYMYKQSNERAMMLMEHADMARKEVDFVNCMYRSASNNH